MYSQRNFSENMWRAGKYDAAYLPFMLFPPHWPYFFGDINVPIFLKNVNNQKQSLSFVICDSITRPNVAVSW